MILDRGRYGSADDRRTRRALVRGIAGMVSAWPNIDVGARAIRRRCTLDHAAGTKVGDTSAPLVVAYGWIVPVRGRCRPRSLDVEVGGRTLPKGHSRPAVQIRFPQSFLYQRVGSLLRRPLVDRCRTWTLGRLRSGGCGGIDRRDRPQRQRKSEGLLHRCLVEFMMVAQVADDLRASCIGTARHGVLETDGHTPRPRKVCRPHAAFGVSDARRLRVRRGREGAIGHEGSEERRGIGWGAAHAAVALRRAGGPGRRLSERTLSRGTLLPLAVGAQLAQLDATFQQLVELLVLDGAAAVRVEFVKELVRLHLAHVNAEGRHPHRELVL